MTLKLNTSRPSRLIISPPPPPSDDRLDAFLCVECGYCASGSFSYEFVSATASNAVAITNDIEYTKAQKMLVACTRMRAEICSLLKERYASLVTSPKQPEQSRDSLPEDWRRVYDGQSPIIPWQRGENTSITLDRLGKEGAVVRAVARSQNADHFSRGSTDRRSTWLAISRGVGGSSDDRRTVQETVIQHIRDVDEDESELLGFLDGSRRAGEIESGDPLSRLLARVRDRHEQSENARQEEAAAAPAASARGRAKSMRAKECLEICERLHAFMREAEREAFELKRRIEAWDRLNRDDLTGCELIEPPPGFSPCRCVNCSGSVASCLLSLWQHLFMVDPENVSPSAEMVNSLLQHDGSSTGRSLQDCKRVTVECIATRSTRGAELVLDCLKKRLAVVYDAHAEEILGRILQSSVVSPLHSSFLDLATEQLEQRARFIGNSWPPS